MTKKKTGRPSDFTQEIFDIICERIEDGASLRKVCENDDTLPARRTVLRWLAKDGAEDLRHQYARAGDERADFYFEQTMEIADDAGTDRDAIAKARLRVDTLKWICARMNPRKYSDKLNIEATVIKASHEDALDELAGPMVDVVPTVIEDSDKTAVDGLDETEERD